METELTAEDRQLLQRLEEELWREETRFDLSRMEEIIAEDFFEFGRSGRIYQRADTLAVPSTPIEAVIPLPDFDVRLLCEGVAQVTYNSVSHLRRKYRRGTKELNLDAVVWWLEAEVPSRDPIFE